MSKPMRLLLGVMLAGIAGCDSLGPDSLDGEYHATTFTMTQTGSNTVDVLAAGGSIHLVIGNDMSTTGTLDIPASVSGGPYNIGLLGSAAKVGDVVTISTVADTFIRDAQWTFDGSSLNTTYVTNGVTVVVTLSKH